jgi:hypothetical protein
MVFSGVGKRVTFSGMKKPPEIKSLLAAYRMPGFRTSAWVKQDEKDPKAFLLTLIRRQKKRHAEVAERFIAASMTEGGGGRETLIVAIALFISISNGGGWIARCAA